MITSGSVSEANAMAATWHSPVSFYPPLYGVSVSPRRATHSLIRRWRSFGVNLLPYKMIDSVHTCGRISRSEREDKLEVAGIEVFEGPKLGVPLIEGAYAAMECLLVDEVELGDHTWFVGEVKSVLVGAMIEGVVDVHSTKPLLYLGNDLYITVDPASVRRGEVRGT
ncbi:MAG: flavin reductase family protein [Candidatus Korarchaeota archaeon]|nr:flavin reductase family protein [Candidatus Korarchaeota archaeon]